MSITPAALETLAYGWYAEAVSLDPEWPHYDDTVTSGIDEVDEAATRGHATGLRQVAVSLLRALGRGLRCAKCGDPIGDPNRASAGADALCRGCGDPA